MTTDTSQTMIDDSTAQRNLVLNLLAVLGQLDRAETDLLNAKLAQAFEPDEADKTAKQVREINRMFGAQALPIVHGLMADRLMAGNRTVPLLSMRDVDRVLGLMFKGQAIDDDLADLMAAARQVVTARVSSTIDQFLLVRPNLYQAFLSIAAALLTVAGEQGLPLSAIIDNPVARAQVYRITLTPETWRKMGLQVVSSVTGIDAGSIFGHAPARMSDEEAATYEAGLDTMTAGMSGFVKEMVAVIRRHFRARGREIWPTTYKG